MMNFLNEQNGVHPSHLKMFYALKAKHRWILNLYKKNFFIPFMVLVSVSLHFVIASLNLT